MPDAGNNPAPGFAKNPSHSVRVTPAGKRVVVTLGGEVIADSAQALLCEETNHDPVFYVPMSDTRADAFTPTDKRTYCPYKGHASHWSISVGNTKADNGAWSYDLPYDEVVTLQRHVAFYPSKVDDIRVE